MSCVDYYCSRWHVWTPNDLLILLHHSLWLRPKEDIEIQDTYWEAVFKMSCNDCIHYTSYYIVCDVFFSNYHIHSITVTEKDAVRVAGHAMIQIKWMGPIYSTNKHCY